MGRAPNSGAPQRVSAHVVPKAQASFDEDEKTTIESGWEDEASTTVEQGEVAEKIRSMGVETPMRMPARSNTGITSTNGGALDELTVDDQRANNALSLLTPSLAPARIVVTAGNDKGQELEIRPGKQYTVGRAIDNDFVLTDIAVSRKHFDLRNENGTWIVVDRGSGNGTVVNGNIEDQPFVLMNGDAIEIGNTSFRFDHANQPARARGSFDDEEPSTVAGKAVLREPLGEPLLRGDDLPLPGMPERGMPSRPKTQPPPAPLPRSRAPSSLPPPGYNPMNGARGAIPPVPSAAPVGQPIAQAMHGGPIGVPMASPTAPTVQPMQNMQALRGPMAPTMIEAVAPHMNGHGHHGMNGHAHAGMNGLLRPQMLSHEPMPGVMPTTIPGQGPPVAPSQPQVLPYSYPNLGANLGDMQQLQINGGIPRDATSTALVQPVPYGAMQAHAYSVAQPQPGITKKVKILLALALLMVVAAIATIAIIRSSSSSEAPKDSASVATTPEIAKTPPPKVEPKVEPKQPVEAKVVISADEQKKLEQKKADEAKRLADEQKKLEEQRQKDEAKRLADEQKKLEAEQRAEELRVQKLEQQKKADEAKKKKAEQKAEPKTEPKRKTTAVVEVKEPKEATTTRAKDPSDIKARAEDLYRAKKFNDAAKALRSALAQVSENDAGELRSLAAVYEQVGKNYNVGMGPATPAVDAYISLEKALNLDRPIGIFTDEIRGKLGAVAPKAAAKFMSDKNYEAAYKAVRVAEGNGGKNSTTDAVRESLVDAANELYTAAIAEKAANPQAARAKLQRIRGMTDKSTILVKAERALRELPAR
jgi:cell division protein FtsN